MSSPCDPFKFQELQQAMSTVVQRYKMTEEKIAEERTRLEQERIELKNLEMTQKKILERERNDQDYRIKWEKETLSRERKEFEEAVSRGVGIIEHQEPVTLEVGGDKFRTELRTLSKCKGSIFPKLVETLKQKRENDRNKHDPCIFIDRDGKHFRFILNFLRQGEKVMQTSPLRKADVHDLREILFEVQYYKIAELERLIQRKMIFLKNRATFHKLVEEGHFQIQSSNGYVTKKEVQVVNHNLTEIKFSKVTFLHPVEFKDCIMVAAIFEDCNFNSIINFTNVDLKRARFDRCKGLEDRSKRFIFHATDVTKTIFEHPTVP